MGPATNRSDPSLVDRVHVSLRERILTGAYAPGSRLVLSRLAADHGVSFIPVREALRRLESERLVIVEPNRGATVAPISLSDMRDIYATRIVLERHALRVAFPRLGEAELTEAEERLAAMSRALEAERWAQAYTEHRRFHFTLYGDDASPWTIHLISQLWSGAERYLRLSPTLRPAPGDFVAEHAAVLAPLREGAIDSAVDLLEANLRRTMDLLARRYGEDG